MALRDVELDWYKVTGYRAVTYSNASFNPDLAIPPAPSGGQPNVAVFFGDVQRHQWLETRFGLRAMGCDTKDSCAASRVVFQINMVLCVCNIW